MSSFIFWFCTLRISSYLTLLFIFVFFAYSYLGQVKFCSYIFLRIYLEVVKEKKKKSQRAFFLCNVMVPRRKAGQQEERLTFFRDKGQSILAVMRAIAIDYQADMFVVDST